ncbi:Protein SEC13 like protein [Pteropus alecto]|uniref:Protein SEC13 homolog n=2 Tax=Pteropus alecto TaxID=9402 RepID=L5KAV7_PTEAL|nr:Protein SEC13 like protein [Pteropus alecto]
METRAHCGSREFLTEMGGAVGGRGAAAEGRGTLMRVQHVATRRLLRYNPTRPAPEVSFRGASKSCHVRARELLPPSPQQPCHPLPMSTFLKKVKLNFIPAGLVLEKERGEMVSVINTVDTSHEDMIHDAQMDYYGTRLATCSSDRSVKIFDVRNSGQILIADLRGHEGPVWQVAWAHPMYGNILASCSYDRKVIIWKEENGTWEKTHEHTGHDSSVNSVCWAPHDYGLILACGSSDGAISLLTYTGEGQWEVKKINNAHTIGCNAVSWAPAVVPGSLIDQPSGQKPNYIKKFASGGCDNLIKLWKEEEDGQWKEEQKLEAHSDWVRDVAWAPSIGLPTSTIASCSQDGRVFIWTCDDASSNMWSPKLLHKFNDVVWHVSWSITANILAVSGGDNKVTLWKESVDGQWVCISDVNKGQGSVSASVTEGQQNEQ